MDLGTAQNLLGLVTSIISAGAVWGIMREKIRHLETELGRIKEARDAESKATSEKFVQLYHFKDVVGPMQASINEIQNDVKKLLVIAHTGSPNRQ